MMVVMRRGNIKKAIWYQAKSANSSAIHELASQWLYGIKDKECFADIELSDTPLQYEKLYLYPYPDHYHSITITITITTAQYASSSSSQAL